MTALEFLMKTSYSYNIGISEVFVVDRYEPDGYCVEYHLSITRGKLSERGYWAYRMLTLSDGEMERGLDFLFEKVKRHYQT